ncbi:MAG: hypothetical protein WCJ61_16715 [Paludibacter sp.]
MRFSIIILLSFFIQSIFSQTSLTIPQIQGTGTSSSYDSQIITTNGIVTAKFVGSGKVGGYFLQDAVGDGNPLTSDGIFVSTTTDNVTVGDKVEITATVREYSSRRQLGSVTKTTMTTSNNALPATKAIYNGSNSSSSK